ncbi:ATP-binding protein [Thermomonospora umbrina]|uniref:Anti-sigma regulatory factor (Ser/Thr protein kinase) n=1 Tax=Thermomonospora umbrina TaxID=111806 RepID=A0A3D9SVV5_9ACTN|nr:hypothetical protein [Thermomonospora umbrina]REE99717.1 hypothetical protein DFJ69_5232 [Thermomonospora umbrina]
MGAVVGRLLPADSSCAGVARVLLGGLLARAGVATGAVEDAQTMISELATNAVTHAGGRGPYELWAYRTGRRVVCGVFDPVPDRPIPVRPSMPSSMPPPHRRRTVGAWRSSTRTPKAAGARTSPGDAWAPTCPASSCGSCARGRRRPARRPARERRAAPPGPRREDPLAERGITRTFMAASVNLAVLSVRRDLDLWCRPGRFHIRDHATAAHSDRPFTEIAAVTEHLVRRHEELHDPPSPISTVL